MSQTTVIIIAGPTASGKSRLAIEVATAVGGVVINADSMQLYQGMTVLSAAPSEQEKVLVPHVLYEILPVNKNGNVVDWLDLAVAEICKCWDNGQVPVVVGGTGMYIDNLINGTTPIPAVDEKIRQQVRDLLFKIGAPALYEKLAEVDAVSAAKLSPNDTTRVSRAYEIFLQTRISIAEWHQKPMNKKLPQAEFLVIKLVPETDELDQRCLQRFQEMVKNGAVEEVQNLQAQNLDTNLPAMKMLGVPDLMAYCRGEISLEIAVEQGFLHTRQYAKRQRTWFRNKLVADLEVKACYNGQAEIWENVINSVKKAL